jgi:molybdate transport system substrate-binding protein
MWRRVSSVLALLVLLTGCGNDTKPGGNVTVFAASSLTAAFTDIGKSFETTHSKTKVTFNFGASSALVLQIQEGNPVDVVALADTKTMRSVSTESSVFAHNRLVIATKPDAHIAGLGDLAHANVVSLCAAEVPCGVYAAESLRKAGVTIDESRVTRGPNVAATLAAVTNGDAAAAIVYATDAKAAGARVHVVAIRSSENVRADYPIAQLPAAKNAGTARAFIAYVRGDAGQRILRRYGFITT